MSAQHQPTAFRALALGASLAAALAAPLARPASAQERRSSLWDPPGSASVATPVNETIRKTTQVLDGMGFTIKSSGADYVIVDSNGLNMVLETSADGSVLYGTVYFRIPKEKVGIIPYEALMDYNGRWLTHFGIDKFPDDKTEIALLDHTSAADMTPKTLKALIDVVSGDAGRHLDLLDPGNWKSSLPEFSNK